MLQIQYTSLCIFSKQYINSYVTLKIVVCIFYTYDNNYLAGTPNSLVNIADMHGIYKSKYPLLIKKTSFEVKHCKIETVVLSRSVQAAKLKKT